MIVIFIKDFKKVGRKINIFVLSRVLGHENPSNESMGY